eukprot:jgi/Hompol1/874/HPOL_005283-RA
MICSSLCQGFKANKQVFGESNGVMVIIPFLKYHSANPHEQESVTLAVIECIWGAISGNHINETQFFQNQGIFLLLDLLETSTASKLKRHILGTLLDLLENPKCIYHLGQWRMGRSVEKGVVHLLIEIWCFEEAELGVPQGPHGTMAQINSRPLLGDHQPKAGSQTNHAIDLPGKGSEADGGRGIHELQENLRISKYLDFKIGEVWIEIADELEFEGIRPVSPDLDCINTVKQVIVKKAEGVYNKQTELLRKSDEKQKKEEQQFFDHLRAREAIRVQPRARTPRHPKHSSAHNMDAAAL